MKSNLKTLFAAETQPLSAVGVVTQAADGQATRITLNDGGHQVIGHLSQVELLQPGDRALVLPTAGGLVVAGRLRAPGEPPAPRLEAQDGRLTVEATRSVRLQAGQSWVEVNADGRILIDGEQITGLAKGRLRLQGATLELN